MNSLRVNVLLAPLALALVACADSREGVVFVDVTELSGLAFTHRAAPDEALALPAVLGSGVALFDQDNDGDLDVFLVQGEDQSSELWINDSEDQNLRFRKSAVLDSAGTRGYGVAVEDVNADGYLDVFVTTFAQDQLYLNSASGFQGSSSLPTQVDAWSASATWVDVNVDGRPDLWVNQVATYESGAVCRSRTQQLDYCGPDRFEALSDRLYINLGYDEQGDVQFEDQSERFGLSERASASLGVRSSDINSDGWPDVYVTSYQGDNLLWMNNKGRAFDERGVRYGVATSFIPMYRGSVGVDAADVDQDGDLDLLVSHALGEPHQYYRNEGERGFVPTALADRGVSVAESGMSLVLLDANADGLEDVFVANGSLQRLQSQLDARDERALRQANSLLLQREPDAYVPAAEQAPGDDPVEAARRSLLPRFIKAADGEQLTPRTRVSRGLAKGDLDNDGDADLIVVNNAEAAQVLQNTTDPAIWFGINPVAANGMTRVGTRVRVLTDAGEALSGLREVTRTRGFLSASDPRLLFYGPAARAAQVRVLVQWPEGGREQFVLTPSAQYHVLMQGEGEAPSEAQE